MYEPGSQAASLAARRRIIERHLRRLSHLTSMIAAASELDPELVCKAEALLGLLDREIRNQYIKERPNEVSYDDFQ